MSKVAVIDSQVSGISGDMLLASLVDAGASSKKVIETIHDCENFIDGSKISSASFTKVNSKGFAATTLDLKYTDSVRTRRGIELLRSLALLCDSLPLDVRAKTFALESLKTLVSAEAVIHGEEYSKVHLHESSSIDTLADIAGTAVALEDLNLFNDTTIISTKIGVGGGIIKFSHGYTPNPTAAILEIFKGKAFTLVGGQVEDELTTPTGAAMLVNLAQSSSSSYPGIQPQRLGYGAGRKHFPEMANILRLVIGKQDNTGMRYKDTVSILETNVDDATGEIIGNMIERLNEAGAKDVTVLGGTSKKNRPTFLIRVLADNSSVSELLDVLFSETGSLGVRLQQVDRVLLSRAVLTVPIQIADNTFNISVKVVKDSAGKIQNIKPEFEDIRIIASRLGISVKHAMELARAELTNKVGKL